MSSELNGDDVRARGLWSNRFMFVLAAAGSAIGLGNIWRFPYLVGKYGGGAFVLMYLACILLIGAPILVAEIMIGREARRNPVGAFRRLSKGKPLWVAAGFLGVASGFVILSYYSVVAGWTLDYFTKSVSGAYLGADVETIGSLFSGLVKDPYQQLVWHTAFMGATIAIVIFGVKEGLERWIGILMPLLFLLLLLLVIYGLVSGEAEAGLKYLFVPDWAKLYQNDAGEYTVLPMLEAMGQAFFTLSLGMGAMITYGSYLGDDESIPGAALMVAALDTAIALLAGIAIYTILFKYNLDPAQGPGLVFKVLPLAFAQMPAGRLIGTAFFLLLSFAALTSAISLLEVVVAYFIDDRKWRRRTASLILGAVIWGLGVFSALSYNQLSGVTLLKDAEGQGMPILDSVDRIANNYMLPIGGFFIALFAGWFMTRDKVHKQLLEGGGSRRFYQGWSGVIKFFTPLAVGLLLVFYVHSQFTTSTGSPAGDLARSGNAVKLKAVIAKSPETVSQVSESGLAPLHYAAQYGHFDAAQLLIESGADINARTKKEGRTPLILAAGSDDNKELVKFLIEKGAEVDAEDNDGMSALHKASESGAKDVASILIEAGARVESKDSGGNTPLHFAAYRGYVSIVKLLLDHHAFINARNDDHVTPLGLTSIQAHGKAADLIRERGGVE